MSEEEEDQNDLTTTTTATAANQGKDITSTSQQTIVNTLAIVPHIIDCSEEEEGQSKSKKVVEDIEHAEKQSNLRRTENLDDQNSKATAMAEMVKLSSAGVISVGDGQGIKNVNTIPEAVESAETNNIAEWESGEDTYNNFRNALQKEQPTYNNTLSSTNINSASQQKGAEMLEVHRVLSAETQEMSSAGPLGIINVKQMEVHNIMKASGSSHTQCFSKGNEQGREHGSAIREEKAHNIIMDSGSSHTQCFSKGNKQRREDGSAIREDKAHNIIMDSGISHTQCFSKGNEEGRHNGSVNAEEEAHNIIKASGISHIQSFLNKIEQGGSIFRTLQKKEPIF